LSGVQGRRGYDCVRESGSQRRMRMKGGKNRQEKRLKKKKANTKTRASETNTRKQQGMANCEFERKIKRIVT
jgi:hypothetical protein